MFCFAFSAWRRTQSWPLATTLGSQSPLSTARLPQSLCLGLQQKMQTLPQPAPLLESDLLPSHLHLVILFHITKPPSCEALGLHILSSSHHVHT